MLPASAPSPAPACSARWSTPVWSALALLLASSACNRPAAPPAASAPPAPAARFCDFDLSGDWLNASDKTFSYRLHDKSDVVEGRFIPRAPDGGPIPPEAGDEPLTLELHRTPTALAGVLRSFDRHPETGRRCPVEFGLKITRCTPKELQVVAETSYPLAKDCSRQQLADGGDQQPDLAEYLWLRN